MHGRNQDPGTRSPAAGRAHTWQGWLGTKRGDDDYRGWYTGRWHWRQGSEAATGHSNEVRLLVCTGVRVCARAPTMARPMEQLWRGWDRRQQSKCHFCTEREPQSQDHQEDLSLLSQGSHQEGVCTGPVVPQYTDASLGSPLQQTDHSAVTYKLFGAIFHHFGQCQQKCAWQKKPKETATYS